MRKTFNLSIFLRQSYFGDDCTKHYSIFELIFRYFKRIGNAKLISSWKSKGLSDEIIKSPTGTNNIINPLLFYLDDKMRVKFDESYFKKETITYVLKTIINIYIVYQINKNYN